MNVNLYKFISKSNYYLFLLQNKSIIRIPPSYSFIDLQKYNKYSRSIFTMASSNQEQTTTTTETKEPIQFMLKTPKGMRDIGPEQAWQRKRIFQIITECFERHGAQPLDTPVCERREILTGKYGDDAKLIYNLEDQGGEALSLRYDLTVPFARYLGQNKILAMTRYHIAKVYRRDNPSIVKGRFREFYQCDVDFAGKYDTMMADSECLEILCEILKNVKLPYDFSIKINHRLILNGMFKICGVPEEKFKIICSSIDKLDKMSWEDVKKEMCTEKGLDEKVADLIGTYIHKSGDKTLLDSLLTTEFGQNSDSKKGLEDLLLLYKYADHMGISKYLKFDLSLARGLDYYTGLIFEAIVLGDVDVGSIAAGGRYDNLVSNLLDNPNFNVPCVGLSIGIERLFAILESQQNSDKNTEQLGNSQIHCCIGSIGKDMSIHRYKIVNILRERGIRVKNVLKDSVKPLVLYQTCEKENVPFAIFFGKDDISNNSISLKTLSTREDEKINIDDLANELEKRLNLQTKS